MTKKIFELLKEKIFVNLICSFLLLISIAIIDWKTGIDLSFQFFYFIPLALFALNEKYNIRVLILIAAVVAGVWFLADYNANHRFSSPFYYYWNTMSRFIVFTFFLVFLNLILKRNSKITKLVYELTKKDKDLIESIKYAKSIQSSVIHSFYEFSEILPNSFIFLKPKNIISGDFFWFYQKENLVFFALIDCTGHSVPGALLSIIGNIMLNKVIIENNFDDTELIMRQLHIEVTKVLNFNDEKIDEGMEVAFVKLNIEDNQITVSQTTKSIIIICPDKSIKTFYTHGYTIGGFMSKRNDVFYISEEYQLQGNSWIYLFTDGYIDQFDTDDEQMFGYNRFLSLLLSIHKLDVQTQVEKLELTLEAWKGKNEQTDDVSVVGINCTTIKKVF